MVVVWGEWPFRKRMRVSRVVLDGILGSYFSYSHFILGEVALISPSLLLASILCGETQRAQRLSRSQLSLRECKLTLLGAKNKRVECKTSPAWSTEVRKTGGGGGGVKNVPVSTYMKISSYLRASCRRRGISGSGSRDSASAGSCRWRSCGPRRRCRPSCSGRCAWRSPCRTRRWAGRSGSPTPGRGGGQVFCQHLVVTQDFLLLKLPNVFFCKNLSLVGYENATNRQAFVQTC